MKKLFLFIVAGMVMAAGAQAQHCAAVSNSVVTHHYANPGLYPSADSLPCTVLGVATTDTFFFQNFKTYASPIGPVNIDSVRIVSIGNLPPGLCWTSSNARNTFQGDSAGAIVVTGTGTGPVGQYKLSIVVNVYTAVTNLMNQDAESYGLRYWIRSKCPSATCTTLDTAKHSGTYPAYIAYNACVGPPVAAINPAGPVTICAGASQTLTASSGTGYTYKWSTGATSQSISVTTQGSYLVTVYNTALDSTISAPVAVNVAALPTVTVSPTGTDSICPGDSATISATATGVSYLWSNAATTSSITVRNAGAYTVTVTDGNQCSAVGTPVTVALRPVPTAAITRSGFTLTADAATSYQWYQDANLISGATAQTYDVTINGNYTVVVTNAAGCSATSAPTAITTVGIRELAAGTAALAVYPNPNTGTFTLATTGRTGDKYEVYDILGRPVQHGVISADHMAIDLGAQQSGIYTITIGGAQHTAARFTVVAK